MGFRQFKERRKGDESMKCKKPLKHKPQFEGKANCKACACEAKEDAYEYLGGEEE
tara:strand:- start:329 stop:493 length:165 start_codon:yes stop_codon:yes gene_type:complete